MAAGVSTQGGAVRAALLGLKWLGIGVGGLLLAFIVGLVVLPPLTRQWTDRWGASSAEVAMRLPGDDIVPDATSNSTKAMTIHAPADLVYKLVVQMGYERGGWYAWDWFYDMTGSSGFVGGRHARAVVPALQDAKVGDTIYINKVVGYRIVQAEPPGGAPGAKGSWVLLATMGPDGKPFDPKDPPAVHTLLGWSWVVVPIDATSSRLILRSRSGGTSQGAFLDWLYDKPLDFGGAIMGYKTLYGIKRTAEALVRPTS